jgi:predicted RNase H-like HicB family nuclease
MRAAQAAPSIRVNIYYSEAARSYWANSPDLDGLAASGSTRAAVEQEARWAAETLLDLQGWRGPQPELKFQDAVFDAE